MNNINARVAPHMRIWCSAVANQPCISQVNSIWLIVTLITNGFADSATPTQYARTTRLSPVFRVRVWLCDTSLVHYHFWYLQRFPIRTDAFTLCTHQLTCDNCNCYDQKFFFNELLQRVLFSLESIPTHRRWDHAVGWGEGGACASTKFHAWG